MDKDILVECSKCKDTRVISKKCAKRQYGIINNNDCRKCSAKKDIKNEINGIKVVKDLGIKNFGAYGKRIAIFICNHCGVEFKARVSDISSGKQDGCRCRSGIISGGKKQNKKLYQVWESMRARCNNKNDKSYYRYGGRGISISMEWNDFNIFREWSIKNGYEENIGLSIDRTDNNKNYCKENCRWTNSFIQSSNTNGLETSFTKNIGVHKNGKNFMYSIMNKGKAYTKSGFPTIDDAVKARRELILKNNWPHTISTGKSFWINIEKERNIKNVNKY